MSSKRDSEQEQLGGGGAGAVLDLLSGKASVDQLARRFGVQPATVEKWREIALEGVAQSLRQGAGKSPKELALEKELRTSSRRSHGWRSRRSYWRRRCQSALLRPGGGRDEPHDLSGRSLRAAPV